MMRGATILWAALATIAGTGLFMLKYEVQAQEQRLSSLRKDIVDTQESIHVLKAEWSYMNDPVRLREQAERHLGLHPMKPSQIASIDSLPMADPRQPSENRALVQDNAPMPQAPLAAAQPAPQAQPVQQQPTVQPKTAPRMVTAQLANEKPIAPQSNGKTNSKADPKKPQPPAKPGKSVTVAKAAPAPLAKPQQAPQPKAVAQAAPKTVVPPQVKPVHAPPYNPAYPVTPASAPMRSAGNVMVITSPALAGQEMASSRVRP